MFVSGIACLFGLEVGYSFELERYALREDAPGFFKGPVTATLAELLHGSSGRSAAQTAPVSRPVAGR